MKKSSNEPRRVAQIMGKWVGGGVEAVVMNYYRHIDRNKIQFDFICDEDSTNIPYEEIESLGGRVIICPAYHKVFSYQYKLNKIFRENKYKIVHSNINTMSLFPLFAAAIARVPVRIIHSHSTANKKETIKTIAKSILKPFCKLFATDYFACTEHAGRWMFGNKTFDKGKVTVINNGIEIENYIYNEKVRKQKRKELNYKDSDIVIGHVGRFMKQKNHEFIIDVFNELHKENNNYKLLLVGQGPLMDKIKEKVTKLGLEKDVTFTGQREDINELYQAMDLFLFPSLYEGLGMVMIEAQCAGLPCIASTDVPPATKVSTNVTYLDLNLPLEIWKDKIKEHLQYDRKVDFETIKTSDFDIEHNIETLEKKYERMENM